jgi:predicted MFS family arabinose efflux permease
MVLLDSISAHTQQVEMWLWQLLRWRHQLVCVAVAGVRLVEALGLRYMPPREQQDAEVAQPLSRQMQRQQHTTRGVVAAGCLVVAAQAFFLLVAALVRSLG